MKCHKSQKYTKNENLLLGCEEILSALLFRENNPSSSNPGTPTSPISPISPLSNLSSPSATPSLHPSFLPEHFSVSNYTLQRTILRQMIGLIHPSPNNTHSNLVTFFSRDSVSLRSYFSISLSTASLSPVTKTLPPCDLSCFLLSLPSSDVTYNSLLLRQWYSTWERWKSDKENECGWKSLIKQEERRVEEKRREERRGEERRGEERRGEKKGEEKRGKENRLETRKESKRGQQKLKKEKEREKMSEKMKVEERRGEERRGEERRGEERSGEIENYIRGKILFYENELRNCGKPLVSLRVAFETLSEVSHWHEEIRSLITACSGKTLHEGKEKAKRREGEERERREEREEGEESSVSPFDDIDLKQLNFPLLCEVVKQQIHGLWSSSTQAPSKELHLYSPFQALSPHESLSWREASASNKTGEGEVVHSEKGRGEERREGEARGKRKGDSKQDLKKDNAPPIHPYLSHQFCSHYLPYMGKETPSHRSKSDDFDFNPLFFLSHSIDWMRNKKGDIYCELSLPISPSQLLSLLSEWEIYKTTFLPLQKAFYQSLSHDLWTSNDNPWALSSLQRANCFKEALHLLSGWREEGGGHWFLFSLGVAAPSYVLLSASLSSHFNSSNETHFSQNSSDYSEVRAFLLGEIPETEGAKEGEERRVSGDKGTRDRGVAVQARGVGEIATAREKGEKKRGEVTEGEGARKRRERREKGTKLVLSEKHARCLERKEVRARKREEKRKGRTGGEEGRVEECGKRPERGVTQMITFVSSLLAIQHPFLPPSLYPINSHISSSWGAKVALKKMRRRLFSCPLPSLSLPYSPSSLSSLLSLVQPLQSKLLESKCPEWPNACTGGCLCLRNFESNVSLSHWWLRLFMQYREERERSDKILMELFSLLSLLSPLNDENGRKEITVSLSPISLLLPTYWERAIDFILSSILHSFSSEFAPPLILHVTNHSEMSRILLHAFLSKRYSSYIPALPPGSEAAQSNRHSLKVILDLSEEESGIEKLVTHLKAASLSYDRYLTPETLRTLHEWRIDGRETEGQKGKIVWRGARGEKEETSLMPMMSQLTSNFLWKWKLLHLFHSHTPQIVLKNAPPSFSFVKYIHEFEALTVRSEEGKKPQLNSPVRVTALN